MLGTSPVFRMLFRSSRNDSDFIWNITSRVTKQFVAMSNEALKRCNTWYLIQKLNSYMNTYTKYVIFFISTYIFSYFSYNCVFASEKMLWMKESRLHLWNARLSTIGKMETNAGEKMVYINTGNRVADNQLLIDGIKTTNIGMLL